MFAELDRQSMMDLSYVAYSSIRDDVGYPKH